MHMSVNKCCKNITVLVQASIDVCPHVFVFYSFEKMISGMYMGEIVRLIILKLCANREIFDGIAPDSVLFNSGLSTAFVSHVLK